MPRTPAAPTPLTIGHTDSGSDRAKEKCGVVAVWGHPDAVHRCYRGLYAQQHRGQESAGIAVSDGRRIEGHVGMGLVPDVFDEREIARLRLLMMIGHHQASPDGFGWNGELPLPEILGTTGEEPQTAFARPGANGDAADPRGLTFGAIGHNRYSTAGGSLSCNAQPIIESFVEGFEESQVAVAHNGNLVNAAALRRMFGEAGHLFHTTSDTEVMVHLLASPQQRETSDPLAATLRRCQGAFSVCFLFPDRVEVARDRHGWRPLVLGDLDGCPCVASETVALEVMGARIIREIEPGEIVTLSSRGVGSRRFAPPAEPLARCVFEHVYFASPASRVFGQSVLTAREAMGERLAQESPADADLVMPMPDSGRSCANGYARASGIPYREGIVPNRYVGRTFIKPTQDQRAAAVRLKLNVVEEIVRGKKIVVVDDSIVRGTTTREKMKAIRAAGAAEIHVRISCPPIRHPCFFGVDFATRDQLIAHGRTVEEIRAFLGVDSLAFLSLEGLLRVMDYPANTYCTACFSGEYRVDIEHPTTGEDGGEGGMF